MCPYLEYGMAGARFNLRKYSAGFKLTHYRNAAELYLRCRFAVPCVYRPAA
jgi:hypothetical protein